MKMTTIYLKPDMHQQLKSLAAQQNKSMSQLIRSYINQSLTATKRVTPHQQESVNFMDWAAQAKMKFSKSNLTSQDLDRTAYGLDSS